MNGGWGISYEIALRWMPLDLTDDKSTLVQVMAWCRQATSHYLSQCWPRSMLPNDVTRPQWVNVRAALAMGSDIGCTPIVFYSSSLRLTSHGMHSLKCDNLGHVGVDVLEEFFQMLVVVVAEDMLGHARVADALDHGGMVAGVGEDVATWGERVKGEENQWLIS